MVPLVAQDMNEFDNPPPLQLLEAGADVGSRDVERFRKLLRVERLFREVEQRMNLGYRPVDAPARAHLPPVEDELLLGRRQVFHIFLSIQKLQYKSRMSTPWEAHEPHNWRHPNHEPVTTNFCCICNKRLHRV